MFNVRNGCLHPPFQTKNQSVPALIKIVNMQPKHYRCFLRSFEICYIENVGQRSSKRPSVSQILYEPVQVRLPHSVFRREKENFRNKKNFMQDLKIGQMLESHTETRA